MKTTLELPDALYRKAKAAAALRGETVADLVAEGLRLVVARKKPTIEKWSRHKVQRPARPRTEEEMAQWRAEEDAFLKLMRGPRHDFRSAAEIVKDGRR